VPRNDPTDTGGLFIGRRPGTAPVHFQARADAAGARAQADKGFATLLLVVELLLCISVWGPQPVFWLWFGSQVDYWTNSVSAGIVSAFIGMLATLFITMSIARRVDHAWKLVRRAAGYHQERGALERIFVLALMVVTTGFLIWFFVLNGPGSSIVSPRQP
jgi:hypothetical protein